MRRTAKVFHNLSNLHLILLNHFLLFFLQYVYLQVIFEQALVVTNLVLEIPSLVFEQLSSKHKIQYAVIAMSVSILILVLCITELVYHGQKARVSWRWKQKIPWFYYPSNKKPFGTVTDIIGLLCALFQCIFQGIAYAFYLQNKDNPIRISIWPLVFAFCLWFSKFQKNYSELEN